MVQQDRVDPAKGSTILRLSNISKNFGAVSALTDIDLEVRAGEVVALVGDNGAGKSTLIKVLAGVHQPSSGRIEFCGQEVSLHSPSRALELGIATVFQDLALCENLDVVANLFLGHELSPWNLDEVAMEVRAWTLLRELAARIPSVREPIASLSGGQRQTVAIARSLLLAPKIIMLDEPTAALGVAQTAEVLNLIERVRDRGLGVIIISHNMEDVRAVADRIGAGRVLVAGMVLVAIGTFLTPWMHTPPGLILAIGVLSAGGAGMAGPAVLMAGLGELALAVGLGVHEPAPAWVRPGHGPEPQPPGQRRAQARQLGQEGDGFHGYRRTIVDFSDDRAHRRT